MKEQDKEKIGLGQLTLCLALVAGISLSALSLLNGNKTISCVESGIIKSIDSVYSRSVNATISYSGKELAAKYSQPTINTGDEVCMVYKTTESTLSEEQITYSLANHVDFEEDLKKELVKKYNLTES